MKVEMERRFHAPGEVRVSGDSAPVIEGYGAVFDSLSEEMWGFREKIAAGAFRKAIAEDDVRGLWNHDPSFILGRNRAGTMDLAEDSRGLLYRIRPPKAAWVDGLVESIRRGDVDGSSFSFRVRSEQWTEGKAYDVRTLLDVELFDVGPATFPAYPETTAAVRSLVSRRRVTMAHTLDLHRRRLALADATGKGSR